MIEMTHWIWFAAGLSAGFLHATLLWRAAQRLTAWAPVLGMLRLGIVASVLVCSALTGGILAATAGWGIGLTALGIWFVVMHDKPAFAPSIVHSSQRKR